MKKHIFILAAAVLSLGVNVMDAATSVQNVKVQQRYPWNGLVDIDYEIVSDSPAETDFYVYFIIKDNDLNNTIAPRTITGDGSAGTPVKKGTHRVTWNMAADMPGFHSSALSASVCASTAIPYLVVDLSGGPDAESYPVRYSAAPPNLEDDTCRTTELWLRFIQPGTFMMGSPTDEASRGNNEALHQVTLTQPYYMGVFEVTQAQWQLVTGTNPASSDTRPMENISYNMIRGMVNGSAWPANGQVDANSFIGKLRSKTSVLLDLPTEAQWEYACRAGTSTPFNNNKGVPYDASLAEVGRFNGNQNDGKGGYTLHTKVGSYRPNAWGVYDMHGNVMEWCLDLANGAESFALGFPGNYPTGAVTDPVGISSGPNRIVRGGFYRSVSSGCRSASRASASPAATDTYWNNSTTGRFGLRVVALPIVR